MDSAALRAHQAPIKARYRHDPATALVTGEAEGVLEPAAIGCRVTITGGEVSAGLHPATGGDGTRACSADMLLQALVGCAGVTMMAVATAMGVPVRGGRVRARGEWDARGTLAVSKETPVGVTKIALSFELDTDGTPEQLAKLVELTERYCVVYQTLRHPPVLTTTCRRFD